MSKKLILFLVICLFSASVGFSQSVIKSFVAPGDGATWGLTWDGQSLWNASILDSASTIYQIDTSGNVLSSFNFSTIAPGLAWDGSALWICDGLDNKIYRFSKSGVLLKKIATKSKRLAGLAWDGANLWVIFQDSLTINKLDSNGNVLKSFSIATYDGNATGLTWDGSSFWLCESFNNKIVQLTVEGGFLQAFSGPGTNATEAEWDGKYLWVSDLVTDRIYQIQVERLPALASAKIVFSPDKWNIQWRTPDQEECQKDEDENGDDVDEDDDDDVGGGLVADGDEGQGKISCYIGEIKAGDSSIHVKHILVETIRLNSIVEVARKKDCDEDDDDLQGTFLHDSQKNQSKNGQPADYNQKTDEDCFFAKILRRHRGFEGKVLKVKFNKFEAINSLLEWVQAGDTVEVTVTGKLDSGLDFEGKARIFITGCRRTFVEDPDSRRPPKSFKLFGNFPNPFNAFTQIRYHLSKDGQVELAVYNLLGKKVKVLVNDRQSKGEKIIFWDGKDDSGEDVASGVYFYQIFTQNESDFGKMTFLK